MDGKLDHFCCPHCRAAPLQVRDEACICPVCARHYPIRGGIPRFVETLPGDVAQVQRAFDFEHRRYQESWYTQFAPRLVPQFLDDCQLPRDWFQGLASLDAGCGSGRWTYALAELGAIVTAFDLTASGVEVAYAQLGDRSNVTLCQADIFHTPFLPQSFDFVMSWGVLHHTPDTRAAFQCLVPLVKPGGTLYVMVYERQSALRILFTDALRWFMRHLPDERRYTLCGYLVIRNRHLARLLRRFLIISFYDPKTSSIDPRTMQFGLYDAYSPRYNHLHTREEMAGWFRANNFGDITILPSPSGAVKVRGRRIA